MASDERKIVIELRAIGGDDDEEEDETSNEKKQLKKEKKLIDKTLKQVANFAVNEIMAEADYQFNKYVSLSEDYKASLMMNNAMTTVNKVKSMAGSIAVAFSSGTAIGNPALGAALAGITLLERVITESLNLNRQYKDQSIQLATDDRTAGYNRSRLGLIDNGRGTYN